MIVVLIFHGRASSLAVADRAAEVDAVVRPWVDQDWLTGAVVAVVTADGTTVRGYGRTSRDAGAPRPDGDTIYEIGSVTKPFTGLLLARMAVAGEVALADPVQKYLPPDVLLPRKGKRPIALADLASHTSGLPRMPDNLAPADADNPYADYQVEQLHAALRGVSLDAAPGASHAYSNLGMGLLGHALARRADRTYEQLVVEQICRPLGMNDTRIALDDAARARLAAPLDGDGGPQKNWDLPTLAGAGALRSTGHDMARFVAAYLGLSETDAPMREAMALSRTRRAAVDPTTDVALGWMIGRRTGAVWHNGQTGGYHAFVGFVPERTVGVVVLANTTSDLPDRLARHLLLRLLGEDDPTPAPPTESTEQLDPALLDAYAGDYVILPGFFLNVRRDGHRLTARATGQGRFKLYPASSERFFYKAVEASITFERDATGKVTALHLDQGGRRMRSPRIR